MRDRDHRAFSFHHPAADAHTFFLVLVYVSVRRAEQLHFRPAYENCEIGPPVVSQIQITRSRKMSTNTGTASTIWNVRIRSATSADDRTRYQSGAQMPVSASPIRPRRCLSTGKSFKSSFRTLCERSGQEPRAPQRQLWRLYAGQPPLEAAIDRYGIAVSYAKNPGGRHRLWIAQPQIKGISGVGRSRKNDSKICHAYRCSFRQGDCPDF